MKLGRWKVTGFLYFNLDGWDMFSAFCLFRTPDLAFVICKTFCYDFWVPGIGGRLSIEKDHVRGLL